MGIPFYVDVVEQRVENPLLRRSVYFYSDFKIDAVFASSSSSTGKSKSPKCKKLMSKSSKKSIVAARKVVAALLTLSA